MIDLGNQLVLEEILPNRNVLIEVISVQEVVRANHRERIARHAS